MTDRPRVEADPGVKFGRPHVGGVSVEALGELVYAGDSVDEVARDYRHPHRGHVLLACWFLGANGSRQWRRRWSTWAETVHPLLAADRPDYSKVADPPDRDELRRGAKA